MALVPAFCVTFSLILEFNQRKFRDSEYEVCALRCFRVRSHLGSVGWKLSATSQEPPDFSKARNPHSCMHMLSIG